MKHMDHIEQLVLWRHTPDKTFVHLNIVDLQHTQDSDVFTDQVHDIVMQDMHRLPERAMKNVEFEHWHPNEETCFQSVIECIIADADVAASVTQADETIRIGSFTLMSAYPCTIAEAALKRGFRGREQEHTGTIGCTGKVCFDGNAINQFYSLAQPFRPRSGWVGGFSARRI